MNPNECKGKLSNRFGIYDSYYVCQFEGECKSQYKIRNKNAKLYRLIKNYTLCSTPYPYHRMPKLSSFGKVSKELEDYIEDFNKLSDEMNKKHDELQEKLRIEKEMEKK